MRDTVALCILLAALSVSVWAVVTVRSLTREECHSSCACTKCEDGCNCARTGQCEPACSCIVKPACKKGCCKP